MVFLSAREPIILPSDEIQPISKILLECLGWGEDEVKSSSLVGVTEHQWQAVLLLALKQGVGPLLYQRLNQPLPGLAVPEPVSTRLRNIFLTSLADTTRLYKQIELVLTSLHAEGIRVIPLKGIYLAEKVYRNIGERPMLDVDLLLERSQMRRSVELMADLGYNPGYPFQVEEECLVMHHLPGLYKSGTQHLELHWNLAPLTTPFTVPIQQIWEFARPGKIAGTNVLEMSPEDSLLHLCLHAAYLDTFSSGLRPICDIAWTFQIFREELDWDLLMSHAQSWKAERSLILGLKVAQKMLGIDIPQYLLHFLKTDWDDLGMEEWAIQQILQPAGIGSKLAQVWMPQTWQRRPRLLFEKLFPPIWEMKQSYPELTRGIFWLLAYLKHLIIVVIRNWQAVWGLFLKDSALLAAAEQRSRINRLMRWQEGENA
ncbi:MAG: hypothetical protein A2Z16_08205 [Chloroflexi bacterium RBG_16_54_18]|nr:MAG: hypothetical protein A2Z16_08205 [Chloroflexi bacterium RBG_16_54_18]